MDVNIVSETIKDLVSTVSDVEQETTRLLNVLIQRQRQTDEDC